MFLGRVAAVLIGFARIRRRYLVLASAERVEWLTDQVTALARKKGEEVERKLNGCRSGKPLRCKLVSCQAGCQAVRLAFERW